MQTRLGLLAGIGMLCLSQLSRADERIVVVTPAILDPNAPVIAAVKRECSLEAALGNEVFQAVSKSFPGTEQIQNANQAGPEKLVLKVSIVGVLAVGGGGWTGPKSMNVSAELLRNMKVIETKALRRQSSGGVLGPISGTCPIMHRIAATLGRDVAHWLPTAIVAVRLKDASSDEAGTEPSKETEATPATEPGR